MSFPSIQLFVDRARAVRPDFQVTEANAAAIAALCDRLEGLPLALELAAARTRLLTPEQILARLSSRFELLESRQRDLPARHRSLRAAMEWSYQLLSPELQQFFARLSVFRGGWTLEAAEAVCGSGVRCWVLGVGESDLTPNTQHLTPTLDLLEQLQESSLLVTEEAPHGTALRYRFLETVREFAAERLPEEEREALAGRHAFYLMSLAETAEPHLAGPDHSEWLERLEAEQENFRAALDWCAGSGVRGQGSGVRSDRGEWSCPPFLSPDPITRFAGTRLSPVLIGLRLGAAMAQFWLTRGYLAEGRTWLEALLAKEEQGGCHHPLRGYAPTPWVTGEEPAGEAAISPGVRRSRVRAQLQLGMLALHHGDYDAARPLLEASLAAAQEMGEPPLLAACLLNLGVIEERTDDHPRASALIEEAVAIYRKLEDERAVATCLVTLADMARHQPDHAPARTLYQEAGSLYRALGDQRDMAWALTRLGSLAVSDGRLAEARAEHEEALALFREMEDRIGIAATLNFLAEVALPRREFHQARQLFHESLAIWRELGSRRDIIWSLKGLGSVALAEIDLETAGAYLDEALAVAWELGSPLGSDDWTQGLPWDALARPGWETAQDCFKRCVQFVREMGSPDILILMLEALGHRARAEGDHEAARRFFQASLIKRRALGDPYGLAQSLEQFAVLAGREQQAGYRVPAQRVDEAWVGAIRLLGAAEALCETLGERPPVTDPTEYERTLTEGRAALGEATFAAAWEEGRALPPGQAVEAALGEA